MTNKLIRALEEDILAQPALLSTTLGTARCEPGDGFDRVVFTGCGDSLHAAIAAAHLAGGRAAEPYDLLRDPSQLAEEGTLLVAISNSGRVRTTCEAAALARKAGATVMAVTSRTDTLLASHADHIALLPARAPQRPLPGMSSYLTCMLAAMMPFSEEGVLDRAPDLVADALETALPIIEPAPCFVGALQNRATALYSAAKLAEVTGAPAHACHTEEFCHVELFIVDRERPVVLFASESDPKATEVYHALREKGHATMLVGVGAACDVRLPPTPDPLLPLVNCVPVQRAVLEAARASGLSTWNFFADEARLSVSDDLIY